MRDSIHLLGIAILASGCASASAPLACPIPGDLQHWQADYCMVETETDDIIAAGPCLERESQIRFRSACDGKLHYKQAMCKLALRAGSYSCSVDSCAKDPLFVGRTVRNGGA
jgi:hypothetical protein